VPTLRIAIGSFLRGAASGGAESSSPASPINLGIAETRSQNISRPLCVRYLQLDEGASHFAHFVTAGASTAQRVIGSPKCVRSVHIPHAKSNCGLSSTSNPTRFPFEPPFSRSTPFSPFMQLIASRIYR